VSLYTAVLGEVTVCLCPQDGWTALHLAAQEGKVDVVRLLTEAQALVNIQSEVLSCLMIGLLLVYTVQ
jgi:ankyrin repeat protein